MLEAENNLEDIFENALKEAEKRKHEYVTIEHLLLAIVSDKDVGTTLHNFKINVGSLIKDIENYCYEDVVATYIIWLHLEYTRSNIKEI